MIESGVSPPVYPYFFRADKSAQIRNTEKSASGSNTDQALQTADGEYEGQSSLDRIRALEKTGRRRKFCSCAAAGEGCLCKW